MRTSILSFLTFALFFAANAQEKIWTLEECVAHAIENNISIQQSELTNEALKEDIRSAEGNFTLASIFLEIKAGTSVHLLDRMVYVSPEIHE